MALHTTREAAQNADIERSNRTSREEMLSESAKNRLPTLCTKFELVINLKAAKDLGRVDLPVGDSGDGGF